METYENEENYETQVKEIHKANKQHLEDFEKSLEAKNLSKKTIREHLNNVDFYINHYLTYYDAQEVGAGCYTVGGFLGNFFIRKAIWSSVKKIKTTAASIKKFYSFMSEQKIVDQEDYEFLCEDIEENMGDWLSKMEAYANPNEECDFFAW